MEEIDTFGNNEIPIPVLEIFKGSTATKGF